MRPSLPNQSDSLFSLIRLASVAVTVSLLAPGCGPNCQSTCDKIFLAEPTGCGIEHPGKSSDDERRDCISACADALDIAGAIPDGYDPDERQSGSQSVQLETDEQAASWMECVDRTACDYLNDGYCAPVWF